MEHLETLLDDARAANRQDRIVWRDPIARYGAEAIPAMREWLTDPEFGAFAVRVLERIAVQPPDRRAALDALEFAQPPTVAPPVARDAVDALVRLGHKRKDPPRPGPLGWSGYPDAQPLEQRFHDDMLDIFRLAGEATRRQRPDGTVIRGYWASYFLRGVRNHGGLAYAQQLLRTEGTTDGFARLTEERRLDLTVESLVLRPEYEGLFSEKERQIATSRLARATG